MDSSTATTDSAALVAFLTEAIAVRMDELGLTRAADAQRVEWQKGQGLLRQARYKTAKGTRLRKQLVSLDHANHKAHNNHPVLAGKHLAAAGYKHPVVEASRHELGSLPKPLRMLEQLALWEACDDGQRQLALQLMRTGDVKWRHWIGAAQAILPRADGTDTPVET